MNLSNSVAAHLSFGGAADIGGEAGTDIEFSEFNTPLEWYSMMVHQGCTRNEYHEYRVEETAFGEKGRKISTELKSIVSP